VTAAGAEAGKLSESVVALASGASVILVRAPHRLEFFAARPAQLALPSAQIVSGACDDLCADFLADSRVAERHNMLVINGVGVAMRKIGF